MRKPSVVAALSLLAGSALIALSGGEANAGDACWKDCVVKESRPVVHRTFKRRIQVEQGVYEIVRTPSVYGRVVDSNEPKGYSSVGRRVLLKPYKNIAVYNRARHVYVTERVVIEPEPIGYAYWWDRFWR